MSRRTNNVRGPNSALTEFLRERGINAADIRNRALVRAAAAAAAAGEAASTAQSSASTVSVRTRRAAQGATEEQTVVAESSTAASVKVQAKGRGGNKAKKRKKDDSDAEDDGPWNGYAKSIPVPGQIAFCGDCESRFTVTAYSRAAEDGEGLMCGPCGKKSAKVDKEVKKKRTTGKRIKREVLRQALDGEAKGPRSLKEYCIRLVAKFIDEVEAFGDLSTRDMDRICQIISRNRSLNDSTLRLFMEPQGEKLALYDCARIDSNELRNIAAFVPTLKHLSLFHAGRMTDEVLSYYAEKLPALESLHIRGAFLVSRQAYVNFFATVGHRLTSLTLSSTARTNQTVIEAIVQHCPNLEYLDLSSLARFDDDCLRLLKKCTHLQSLDISFTGGELTDSAVVEVLNVIGSGLKELNLSGNPLLTSETTNSIHACCAHLRSLNLNECELLTDDDITNIFTNWTKNSGLRELQAARVVELTDQALLAAVNHSGQTLEVLNINSCYNISKQGLLSALTACKKLTKFDAAFVRDVDDDVIGKMQRVGIKGVSAWGCTKVTACCEVGHDVSLVGREADIAA